MWSKIGYDCKSHNCELHHLLYPVPKCTFMKLFDINPCYSDDYLGIVDVSMTDAAWDKITDMFGKNGLDLLTVNDEAVLGSFQDY